LVVTAYLGRKSGQRTFVRLALIFLVAAVSAILAFAQIRGPTYGYLITQWARVVGMFLATAPVGKRHVRAFDAKWGRAVRDWALAAAWVALAVRAGSVELDGKQVAEAYMRLAPGIRGARIPWAGGAGRRNL
jgi:hypothetical protein